MEEIEIGEYVRTKNGYILKNTIREHKHIIDGIINQNEKYKYEFDNIEKHSKSIMDLIEIGDYVNGYKVCQITGYYVEVESNHRYDLCFEEEEIESIMTKEQFENNCYRVEE